MSPVNQPNQSGRGARLVQLRCPIGPARCLIGPPRCRIGKAENPDSSVAQKHMDLSGTMLDQSGTLLDRQGTSARREKSFYCFYWVQRGVSGFRVSIGLSIVLSSHNKVYGDQHGDHVNHPFKESVIAQFAVPPQKREDSAKAAKNPIFLCHILIKVILQWFFTNCRSLTTTTLSVVFTDGKHV